MTRLVSALSLTTLVFQFGLLGAFGLSLTACEENKNLSVTGVEPKNGKYLGGDRVYIEGTGFSTQGFTVYFGKKKASNCIVESPVRLACDTPAGTKDEVVDVQVVFDDSKESTRPKAFKYIDPIGEVPGQVPTTPAPPK
jgi:hypothetical protein